MIACQDCFWVATRRDGYVCEHPKCFASEPNWYTGAEPVMQHSLNDMRTIGPCKPEALLFAPLPPSGKTRAQGGTLV